MMARAAALFCGLLVSACSADATSSSSELTVNAITFAPGCGALTPQNDCSYGFVMSYMQSTDVTVAHETDNVAKTVDITVDVADSQIHTTVQPEDKDLGLLDAKPGQSYAVTVYDRKHAVLWSGKVDTLYHL